MLRLLRAGYPKGTAKRLAAALAVALIAAGAFPAEALQPGKVYRVGILGEKASDPWEDRLWQTFRLGLREHGWVEGQNILIESRWAEGDSARLPELAADLVRLKVDLIVTRGSTYTEGARRATSSIPIVFTMHADPVATGHVASFARPGGNMTGLSDFTIETEVKRLELLKAIDPRIKRVAVLYNPDVPSHPPRLRLLEGAAHPLQLQLQTAVARTGADLDSAFSAMIRAQVLAVVALSGPPFVAERLRLAALAIKYRLPTMFAMRNHVEAGGLMSYGPDYSDLVRRAATYVDKILRGVKPGDLPVERPTKFELVINLKTAKAIGVTIPPLLLQRADQIVE
jgi:putative ABC transport system substrate-binding protein